jgi:hypothetical protein
MVVAEGDYLGQARTVESSHCLGDQRPPYAEAPVDLGHRQPATR